MQKEPKRALKIVKGGIKSFQSKLKNKAATAYLFLVCSMGPAMTAFASVNPAENARNIALGYLKPIVYIGCGVFGVILIVKRKTTELISFVIVAAIAILLIFYPDTAVNFLGGVVQQIFG